MSKYQFRFTVEREFESSDDASRFMKSAADALAASIGPGWMSVQMELGGEPTTAWVPAPSAKQEGGS